MPLVFRSPAPRDLRRLLVSLNGPGSVALMRWWTSDHHFGHENIIGFCDRPFLDAPSMSRALLERWNDLVCDGDEVWILGDLAMGDRTVTLPTYVAPLRGTKILVPGNHDLCWAGNRSSDIHMDLYQAAGIDRIVHKPTPVTLAGETVRLSHFPYRAEPPESPQRFAQWRPEASREWLLCGHVHNAWRQKGRQINVGVDAWHFSPVNDDTLAALIATGPDNIPCPTYSPPPEWFPAV